MDITVITAKAMVMIKTCFFNLTLIFGEPLVRFLKINTELDALKAVPTISMRPEKLKIKLKDPKILDP
ncbi:hypothetical protein GCM10022218_21660 [Sphingobacterium ginsenosidimutans]|uniref:Uncharacterized protein n=1 Tax=Sphingobacterium ginsenosidimutans TaxID=687845 RepID=A0ABP8A1J7_9SPHI